eukprot:2337148-Alexandrium_andersonii.AAC.1
MALKFRTLRYPFVATRLALIELHREQAPPGVQSRSWRTPLCRHAAPEWLLRHPCHWLVLPLGLS